jgi:nitroimidazol reductase NimA-like FMN-containing flavoprotein (pyridoxamine 5'-phosphate oxidase superfamily)
MAMDARTKRFIMEIVDTQTDLTLATLRDDGYPQANTLGYANDGLTIYFGTDRASQKVKNLLYCNKVSLTIVAPYAHWGDIKGLSMGGTAEVLPDDSSESRKALDLITRRFPTVLGMSPPVDPSAMVFVRVRPKVISVLDYRKGFGHAELVQVEPVTH